MSALANVLSAPVSTTRRHERPSAAPAIWTTGEKKWQLRALDGWGPRGWWPRTQPIHVSPHHHHVLQLPTDGPGVALLATIPATGWRTSGVSGQLLQRARPSLGLILLLLVAPLPTPPTSSPVLARTATLSLPWLCSVGLGAPGMEMVRRCGRRHSLASGVQEGLKLYGPRQCCLHIHWMRLLYINLHLLAPQSLHEVVMGQQCHHLL